MKYRLNILDKHNLKLQDIQNVIAQLKPLAGALDFLNWMKSVTHPVIVSDTFVEFANPLMKQLDWPFLLCHSLETDSSGRITNYKLRQPDPKRKTVQAFKSLNYNVVSFGDSYNDISMLEEADKGILYRPPENVMKDYPNFPVVNNYQQLKDELLKYI